MTTRVVRIKRHNCTVEKLFPSCDYVISAGYGRKRRYSNYTLKEAISLFRHDDTIWSNKH